MVGRSKKEKETKFTPSPYHPPLGSKSTPHCVTNPHKRRNGTTVGWITYLALHRMVQMSQRATGQVPRQRTGLAHSAMKSRRTVVSPLSQALVPNLDRRTCACHAACSNKRRVYARTGAQLGDERRSKPLAVRNAESLQSVAYVRKLE